MYSEDDLVPLSALQHFLVCPRQCALIHLEQVWLENRQTAEGRVAHERVDGGGSETRDGIRRVFGMALRSLRLGLVGRADAVEFHPVPFPVEHKHGRPKVGDEDRVQLCAQALCLEEMTGETVAAGALFYGERRRRTEVNFDEPLRRRTEAVAASVHALITALVTPPPPEQAPCGACSLAPLCRPDDFRSQRRSVAEWIAARLRLPEDP
ncbi:MAG: CRISPR-associated protein Cas4 [Azospirillaceae bacterium]|nr:CRISPR-associated protein Cas4 [Azospirillaceae bacterium]